jgi:ABC-type amino acid transport substrate-binding protein
MLRLLLISLTLFACAARAQAPPDIVFLAPLNHAMPIARFEGGALTGGILKDLGDAIAQRLHRQARYVAVPSKRVALALSGQEADGVCYLLPGWIDGDYHWSRPLIPNNVAVVAHRDVPVIRSIAQLAGVRVGTVLGYRYEPLEKALGSRFVRDDAASTEQMFAKLLAGRVDYAMLEQMTIGWYLRNQPGAKLRADVVIASFKASCAFSKASRIPFADLDRAIDAVAADGTVDTILSHYR